MDEELRMVQARLAREQQHRADLVDQLKRANEHIHELKEIIYNLTDALENAVAKT